MVLLRDLAVAGSGLQQAGDAARGAEALGLPLGVDLVDGVAVGEVKFKIGHSWVSPCLGEGD